MTAEERRLKAVAHDILDWYIRDHTDNNQSFSATVVDEWRARIDAPLCAVSCPDGWGRCNRPSGHSGRHFVPGGHWSVAYEFGASA